MDLFIWALVMQLLLFIYFEIITLVPLYPWNDLSKYSTKEKVLEAATNGVIIVIGIGLFVTKIQLLMVISIVLWGLFLVMQLLTWWLPYITGKHLKQFSRELYDTHFEQTVKLLPRIKDHIIPDAQHLVLQVLTLSTLLTTAIAVVS